MKNSRWRAGTAALLAGAVLSAVAVAPAHAADSVVFDGTVDNSGYAYHLNPANEIDGGAYTVTWDPTSRTDDGASTGSPAGKFGPATVKVTAGCPEGYRKSSRTFIVTSAGDATPAAVLRSQIVSSTGLTGQPITLTSIRASSWGTLTETSNPTGVNAYVITCDAPLAEGGYPADTRGIGNSKYFVTYFAMNWSTNHWEVTAKPSGPSKTATTTTLESANTTTTGTTLTATVAPAAATGTVQFKKDGVAVGTPVAVSGGTAAIPVDGLAAGTAYPFTAEYSGDSTYEASTGSVTVTTVSAPVQGDSSSPVTVTVPAAGTATPTGLKISVKPGALALTGSATRTQGQTWDATGQLDTVTVNDDRQSATAGGWTLNGRISALTSGSNTIAASNVGWKPEKVDGSGTAGAEVTAGADGGLTADKPFATGNASADANVATKVKATVTLKTPAQAPSGDYTGTLTLTLI